MTIIVEAQGSYTIAMCDDFAMPDDFQAALAAEIEKHMQGYGLKDVLVKVRPAKELKP